MNPLAPCPGCRRHVRVSESACPFCHTAITATITRGVVPGATQRMKRAAAFAFTATLTVAGCGGTSTTDAGTDSATVTDSSTHADSVSQADTATGTDTGTDVADNGNIVAAYGGPTFPDAGFVDAGEPTDDGNIVAAYGGPTFPDSGAATDATTPTDSANNTDASAPLDHGGAMALYGAPAFDGGGGGLRYGAPPVWDV